VFNCEILIIGIEADALVDGFLLLDHYYIVDCFYDIEWLILGAELGGFDLGVVEEVLHEEIHHLGG